jgi:transposase
MFWLLSGSLSIVVFQSTENRHFTRLWPLRYQTDFFSVLLERIYSAADLPWLRQVPAVETLRQVWLQQYWLDEGQVKRRQPREMPPVSQWLRSPYDTEVRYGNKGDRTWIGYKVHFTETCGNDCPHVITQVETVPATQQDHHALAPIQAGLAEKQLLPAQQLVDAGYISAKRIIESQINHGIDLLGPVHTDPSWQARTAGAFDVSCFEVAWEQKSVTCPQGQQSIAWHLSKDAKGESVVQILFDKATCQACAVRSRCTRGQRSGRSLTLRYPAERHEMLQAARTRQATEAFRTAYRKRAGIEGTFSQALRIADLRHTRYIGIQKTHLQHLATAAATNILRVINWLNELPLAPTRTSRFAALAGA